MRSTPPMRGPTTTVASVETSEMAADLADVVDDELVVDNWTGVASVTVDVGDAVVVIDDLDGVTVVTVDVGDAVVVVFVIDVVDVVVTFAEVSGLLSVAVDNRHLKYSRDCSLQTVKLNVCDTIGLRNA